MAPEARYANYVSVGHTECEILLEFGQYYEGDAEPVPHTRIITSPLTATTFLELLKDSLDQYVRRHGLNSGEKPNE